MSRGTMDYYGGSNLAGLVDKEIGDAYWTVKAVKDSLDKIEYVVNYMQAITDLAGSSATASAAAAAASASAAMAATGAQSAQQAAASASNALSYSQTAQASSAQALGAVSSTAANATSAQSAVNTATTQAGVATTQAGLAAGYAQTATAKASAASDSAASAANSVTAAAASASSASTSASAAAASASQAQAWTGAPGDGTVTTNKIVDGAVTPGKLDPTSRAWSLTGSFAIAAASNPKSIVNSTATGSWMGMVDFQNKGTSKFQMTIDPAANGTNAFQLYDVSAATARIYVDGNGKVGFGKAPAYQVDSPGDINTDTAFRVGGVQVGLSRNSVDGLVIKNNTTTPNTKMDVSADSATLVNSSGIGVFLTNIAVTADITVTGANGLDTGTRISNTWYHVFLAYNPTTQAVIALYSLVATSPGLPSGYTNFMRVGAVFYGSSALAVTTQRGARGQWNTPQTLTIANPVVFTNFVPPTATRVNMSLYNTNVSGGAGWVTLNGTNVLWAQQYQSGQSAEPSIELMLNAGTIAAGSSGSTTLYCLGWTDKVNAT